MKKMKTLKILFKKSINENIKGCRLIIRSQTKQNCKPKPQI